MANEIHDDKRKISKPPHPVQQLTVFKINTVLSQSLSMYVQIFLFRSYEEGKCWGLCYERLVTLIFIYSVFLNCFHLPFVSLSIPSWYKTFFHIHTIVFPPVSKNTYNNICQPRLWFIQISQTNYLSIPLPNLEITRNHLHQ